ncbi:MAG: hypothetical protein IJ268_14070 [Proteobacteria bacterium]|nr:hypothetical protein [Pseudomonadota bacterium]
MKKRQLSVMAFCAVAALGVGLYACDDDAGSDSARKAKEGQSCASMDCESGLECSADKICIDPSKVSEDKAQLGDDCGADKACADGLECGAEGKCVEKSGPADEKAKLGEDCGAEKACADGLECGSEGKCVEKNVGPGPKEDPCEGVNCPDGRMCLNAKCYDPECIVDGAEMACDSGKMCSKGECVDDGCQDKVCNDGEVCSHGVCEDALCLEKAVVCSTGSTCVKGACIDNECLGETCDAGLTCSKGACMYPACVGKEACAPGKSCNEAGECVFSDAPALNAAIDKTEIDESGASAAITVSLNNPPGKSVSVTCALSPESAAAEAAVDCENILFNADNFSGAQTIHVVGLPDNIIDADQQFKLTITTVSEDADFNGLEKSFDITNKNIDKVGVKVEGANLQTTESGGSAVFTVVLNAKPEADVTFEVSSSNEAYGKIDGATENKLVVTFTPENWDTPQEIKVVGQEDGNAPNNGEEHKYQVVFSKTSSEDANYKEVEISPIDVTNLDNDIADVFIDKETIETVEMGDAVDVNIRLGLAPKHDVNFSLLVFKSKDSGSEESKEVQLSETSFTLTKDNYLEGKTISIRSIDDHIVDGDQDYFIRLRAGSNDDAYNNKDKWIAGKSIDGNTAGFRFNASGTTVSEDEVPIEIGLSLTAIPEAPVDVVIGTSNKYEMVVSPSKVTFTPENWDTEQKLTVAGVDDVKVDGDQVSDLTLKAVSEDKKFSFDDKVEITTLDNDKAEIIVTAKGVAISENTDETIKFDVVLSAQPDDQVRIKLKSSDESELKIYGQQTLVFDNENWNKPQTVMLQVVDDAIADGVQIVHIDLTATSEDKNFNGLTAVTPDYSVLDDESAEVTLTAAKTVFKPGEPTQTTVSVVLTSPPEKDVPVKLNTSNDKTIKFAKTDLVFTTSNWNTPQEVQVTTDASVAPSNKSVTTISALASGTGSYKDRKSNNVDMTLYYFIGAKDFAYSGSEQTMTLLPGKYKLQVWGAAGGDGVSNNVSYSSHGGLGGYSEGVLNLKEKTVVYAYVGGIGTCSNGGAAYKNGVNGGYNGGGSGTNWYGGGCGYGGGGASDFRLGSNSLYARVIVAGGGGGADNPHGATAVFTGDDGSGGYGGGSAGGNGYIAGSLSNPVGATQTAGYSFGVGGSSIYPEWDTGGGGGGWFGGRSGVHNNGGASGGSGFVWMGAADVSQAVIGGTWLLTADQKLESGRTVAGNQSFPSTGAGDEIGHKGNGYARITFVE